MKRKIMKTIGYRISASIIAQVVSFLLFRRFIINLGILVSDMIQMLWYYAYEGLWENDSMDRIKEKLLPS